MKLLVPYMGDLNREDARLVRLAEFLGCDYQRLAMEHGCAISPRFLDVQIDDKDCCFVVNPAVIRHGLSSDTFPAELASYLSANFPFVLVHNLSFDPFAASTLRSLSQGVLVSLKNVENSGLNYQISSEHPLVCGAFSGLQFGIADPAIDRVFSTNSDKRVVSTYAAIGGQPFFVGVQRKRAQMLILAARLTDLDATTSSTAAIEQFSQLVPATMLLRYVFGDQCWHPNHQHAALIIDDPLLRKRYGFLNFDRLLQLMDGCNFHTSIAFIPHNCQRSSKFVARMFRERTDRFSVCFHGNDHTAAEFATKDSSLVNSMLNVAENRMDMLRKKTGIRYDRVMVFPQGNFSAEAMKVLKAHNFLAAVNSGLEPFREHVDFTFAELLQPAILRYGGFPLFLRQYVHDVTLQAIAFDNFFGKPVFIVGHHELFKNPECLIQLVSRINALVPEIRWSSLRVAIENCYLARKTSDGVVHVRPYSNVARIQNSLDTQATYSIAWASPTDAQNVLVDGASWKNRYVEETRIPLYLELPPQSSRTLSLVHQNDFGLSDTIYASRWKAAAFIRRRLSEIRDNYLSKNDTVLSVARRIQRHLFVSDT